MISLQWGYKEEEGNKHNQNVENGMVQDISNEQKNPSCNEQKHDACNEMQQRSCNEDGNEQMLEDGNKQKENVENGLVKDASNELKNPSCIEEKRNIGKEQRVELRNEQDHDNDICSEGQLKGIVIEQKHDAFNELKQSFINEDGNEQEDGNDWKQYDKQEKDTEIEAKLDANAEKKQDAGNEQKQDISIEQIKVDVEDDDANIEQQYEYKKHVGNADKKFVENEQIQDTKRHNVYNFGNEQKHESENGQNLAFADRGKQIGGNEKDQDVHKGQKQDPGQKNDFGNNDEEGSLLLAGNKENKYRRYEWKPKQYDQMHVNGCPHSLPLQRVSGVSDTVLAAPKVNSSIGKIAFNPKNTERKFIR